MYKLIDVDINDITLLIDFKLKSITENATGLSKSEINKIKKYVKQTIPKQLSEYKIISVDNHKVGCFLITKYEDGLLLDEIYLTEIYRNHGIGSNIIENILKGEQLPIYLWVYKNNVGALRLYKKLGFNVIEETESRYFMKYLKYKFER